MNKSEEDYLKVIYELTIECSKIRVGTQELANYFNYKIQSIIDMMQKLMRNKMVDYLPYKGVMLTNLGKKEAIKLIRSHRLWEVFLMEKLNFNWKDIHDDAEKLEHAASSRVVDALEVFLNYPKHCQHGGPIPDINGNVEAINDNCALNLNNDDKFILSRITGGRKILEFLDLNNIKLNDEFILRKNESNLKWISNFENKIIHIPFEIAKFLYVKII